MLKLDNNNLTSIDNSTLSMINRTLIANITFHDNPWNCDCELLNFTKFLRENFKKVPVSLTHIPYIMLQLLFRICSCIL